MTTASYTAYWTSSAEKTAATWADQPEAQRLIAHAIMLDELSDALAGSGLDHTPAGISEDILDVETALENLRDCALSEAWAEHPSTRDDDQWELEELAPSVEAAIAAARKVQLAPTRWIGPHTVAA